MPPISTRKSVLAATALALLVQAGCSGGGEPAPTPEDLRSVVPVEGSSRSGIPAEEGSRSGISDGEGSRSGISGGEGSRSGISDGEGPRYGIPVEGAPRSGIPAEEASRSGDLVGEDPRSDPVARGELSRRAPTVDHHMHIRSEEATRALLEIQEAVGQQVVDPEEAVPLDGASAVAALDSAGLERGVVLSVAYFYGNPDVGFDNARARTRAENDFVAAEVTRFPDRLVGFFSVNPLAEYAMEEIERASEVEALVGLKLHFGNSDVDLRDPDHRERLRRVFTAANRLGTPVVAHVRTRSPEYGEEDGRLFVHEVLSAAPGLPVQIAHLAGQSAFDEATDRALAGVLEAMEVDPEAYENVFFDLAAVPIPLARAGGDRELEEQVRAINRAVVERARAVGFDRVVFGSDSFAVSLPDYLDGLRADLPMEEAELDRFLGGRAPYLR